MSGKSLSHGGNCEESDIVYQGDISLDNKVKFSYIGLSSTKFISRFHNHKKSFKHRQYRADSESGKQVWDFKDQKENPKVTFRLVKKVKSYQPGSPRCNLCLEEIWKILTFKCPEGVNLLNTRTEMFSRCRHRARWKLG